MVKVNNSEVISIFELEQKQMQWLRDALATIKFINNNSLADAKKKESVASNINKAIQMEKEISQRLTAVERSALDYIQLTRDQEVAQRLKTSLPFLTKYQIEGWLNKLSKYLQEENYSLIIRTLEEELLDAHFGMLSGRSEHTKLVEQRLPEEERSDARVYNNLLQQLKDTLSVVQTKHESAQFKEGTNSEELLTKFNETTKNLLGKGFLLWKSGVVPELEKYYEKDQPQLKESTSLEISPEELQLRQNSLTRLENGLMEAAQAAFHLMEANIVYTSEQLEQTKEHLADIFIAYQTRAFNLIIPLRQRNELRPLLVSLNGYFNRSQNVETDGPALPSDVPEFVYEFFTTMEELANGAKQKAEENDYKEAVLRLEELYRLCLRREWERLKKPPVTKVNTILLERNNDIQSLVQVVRNAVRGSDDREKHFSNLVLSIEQTNQLLAARRGLSQ